MENATISISNRIEQFRLFGLVAFKIHIPGIDYNNEIRISAGNWSRDFHLSELTDKYGQDEKDIFHFHLVTQLLENGPIRLDVIKLTSRHQASYHEVICAYEACVDNQGALAEGVRMSLERTDTPIIAGSIIDSTMWPHGNDERKPWFDLPNDTTDVPLSFTASPTKDSALNHLRRWGFCILPDHYPADQCDVLNAAVEHEITIGKINYKWGSSQRILNVHRLPEGRSIWCFPPVIDFLRTWFDDDPVACQTLYYMFGSQQDAHQDTIHLTPYPSGYMCGVWVALQDVDPNSGELFVYPGSHIATRLRAKSLGLDKVREDYSSYTLFDQEIRRLMNAGQFQMSPYHPQKGQILIWHENLVHGGMPRKNMDMPRRSIVSHYFARGALAYYDSRGQAAALEEID